MRTGARGACGNAKDVPVYDAKRTTFKQAVQAALLACVASWNKEACVVQKLSVSPGLSAPCAKCWYAEGMCTLRSCAAACLNPASAGCAACSKEHCFPACVQCSGMPLWAFPP